jgi:hypothetical protein
MSDTKASASVAAPAAATAAGSATAPATAVAADSPLAPELAACREAAIAANKAQNYKEAVKQLTRGVEIVQTQLSEVKANTSVTEQQRATLTVDL